METYYEYLRIEFCRIEEIHKLGLIGWEAFNLDPTGNARSVILRKPTNTDTQIWEYKLINICADSNKEEKASSNSILLNKHIDDCGWIEVGVVYYYYGTVLTLYKRNHSYMGTDDGDILYKLNNWGYSDNYTISLMEEILKIKYEESCAKGYNVGTSYATKYWISNIYIPRILKKHGIQYKIENNDTFFEQLQNYRIKIKDGEYIPDMEETILRWIKDYSYHLRGRL